LLRFWAAEVGFDAIEPAATQLARVACARASGCARAMICALPSTAACGVIPCMKPSLFENTAFGSVKLALCLWRHALGGGAAGLAGLLAASRLAALLLLGLDATLLVGGNGSAATFGLGLPSRLASGRSLRVRVLLVATQSGSSRLLFWPCQSCPLSATVASAAAQPYGSTLGLQPVGASSSDRSSSLCLDAFALTGAVERDTASRTTRPYSAASTTLQANSPSNGFKCRWRKSDICGPAHQGTAIIRKSRARCIALAMPAGGGGG